MNKGYISKKKAIDELDYAYMHCADIDRYGLSTALDVDSCEIGDQYTDIRIHKVEKTGRHYEIVEVLKKMREE